MKKHMFAKFAVACALLTSANAATTITANNYALGTSGFATQVVTDATTKAPFSTGVLMIGTFTNTTGLGTTAGNIDLATYGWSMFASTPFNTSTNQPGLFGATSSTGTLPTTNTGLFVGKEIFAVVANTAGTDFIVWSSGKLFAAEVEGLGGAAVSFATRDETTDLVRGIVVPGGTNLLGGSLAVRNGSDAVTFGAVPEPSIALLGALGVFGLIRRRR